MKISKSTAYDIWHEQFGDAEWALDFSGRLMYIEDYGNEDAFTLCHGKRHPTGWDLHHILPKAQNGQDTRKNLLCTAITTNREIGNRTTFNVNGTRYQVKRNHGTPGYHIEKLS